MCIFIHFPHEINDRLLQVGGMQECGSVNLRGNLRIRLGSATPMSLLSNQVHVTEKFRKVTRKLMSYIYDAEGLPGY